jgi:hypothetical protein
MGRTGPRAATGVEVVLARHVEHGGYLVLMLQRHRGVWESFAVFLDWQGRVVLHNQEVVRNSEQQLDRNTPIVRIRTVIFCVGNRTK